VSRLWDAYVFEGDAVLVRAAVALLLEREMALLGAKSVDEVKTALMGANESGKNADKQRRVIGETGAEDRWMRTVRDAGRC
jgi:hypothetical protein